MHIMLFLKSQILASVSGKLWVYEMKAKGNYAVTSAFLVLWLFLCVFTVSSVWPCIRIALLHQLFVEAFQQQISIFLAYKYR